MPKHIDKIAILHNSHVKESTRLDARGAVGTTPRLIIDQINDGWLICILHEDKPERGRITKDLWRCIKQARKQGCKWLILSNVGDKVKGLKTYA